MSSKNSSAHPGNFDRAIAANVRSRSRSILEVICEGTGPDADRLRGVGRNFGEGIDLVGDRLIGAIVVGVGLPQLCLERDLISERFAARQLDGYDFAYRFPRNESRPAGGWTSDPHRKRSRVCLVDRSTLCRNALSTIDAGPLGARLVGLRRARHPRNHCEILEWWAMRDSNPRPPACKADALPLR
jgi:hypothetical protein